MEEVIARVLQLFLALTGAYALALWFALVVWTYRDITARTTNPFTQIFSTLVVVLFFVPGAIIYLILRPRETLDDAFQRTMEEEYLLQDLDDFPVCPSCRRSVRDDFLYCPHCRVQLRQACVRCHRLVDTRWEACPYCAAPQYESLSEPTSPAESGQQIARSSRRQRSGTLQAIDGGRSRSSQAEQHRTDESPDDEPTIEFAQARGLEVDQDSTDSASNGTGSESSHNAGGRSTVRGVRDQG